MKKKELQRFTYNKFAVNIRDVLWYIVSLFSVFSIINMYVCMSMYVHIYTY